MILVLCDENDVSALWAAEALRVRGLSPTVLTSADLAGVQSWRHRVGTGTVHCEISLSGEVVWRVRTSTASSTGFRLFRGPGRGASAALIATTPSRKCTPST